MHLLFYITPNCYGPNQPGSEPTDSWVEQNSPAMRDVSPGDSVWVFSRRVGETTYFLGAQIIVGERRHSPTGEFGCYRVYGGPGSIDFVEDGQPDLEPLLRSLSITINADYLAQSFQGPAGVRRITEGDHRKLLEWSQELARW